LIDVAVSKTWTIELVAVALVSAAGLLLVRGAAPESAEQIGDPRTGGARSGDFHTDDARATPGAVSAPAPGHGARSPAEIPATGWWSVLKRVVTQFNDHRLMYEAGSVVFFVLLALFPALAALVSFYGLFADPKTVADHLAMLSTVMPAGSMDILNEELTNLASNTGSKLSFGVFFGFAVSLWSANQGMKSLFDVLNVAYDEQEKRSYIRLTLITLGFTFACLMFAMIAIAAVVVLPAALQFIYLGAETDVLVRTMRWPVLLVVVTLLLSVIYRYGPSRKPARWRWVTWGGTFAAITWLLVSFAFSYYVSKFGTYNKTYGSLGAVIGFMTWIWISVMVVLVGAELNAELEHQTARDSTVGPERPVGARGATKADEVVAT
jgi:membrane protein